MIVIPMPWPAVPADSVVILPDGRQAHVSGMLDVYGCRLADGVPFYPSPSSPIVPVILYTDVEMGEAVATLARYFTIENVTVEGS